MPFRADDFFHVAIVTPVLHFTMGGLEINDESAVLGTNGPIPGLFASGEVAGGVHGANRLGGSSLLGCVVYGRVSGGSASKYLFNKLSKGGAPGASGAGNVKVNVLPDGGVQIDVSYGGQAASAPVSKVASSSKAPSASSGGKAAAKPKKDTTREITVAEVCFVSCIKLTHYPLSRFRSTIPRKTVGLLSMVRSWIVPTS